MRLPQALIRSARRPRSRRSPPCCSWSSSSCSGRPGRARAALSCRTPRCSGWPPQGQIRTATQLDYDHRLLVTDRAGKEGWTTYPANGALQDQLLQQLGAKGADVAVDSQSGKQARRLIVQVLLPILILAALFALFMRLSQQSDAGGMGSFSRWRGRRSAIGPGNEGGPSFRDVAGAGSAVEELQELCDLLRSPERYAALGRAAAEGRAARRPARHGQDAAGPRDGRRGARRVLLGLGRRVRGVARRRRRGADPRPVRQGP